jgi:hypothetical protein
MKASVAYKTLDNITVVLLAFKGFKKSLQRLFEQGDQSSSLSHVKADNFIQQEQDEQCKESG